MSDNRTLDEQDLNFRTPLLLILLLFGLAAAASPDQMVPKSSETKLAWGAYMAACPTDSANTTESIKRLASDVSISQKKGQANTAVKIAPNR